MIAVIIPTLNEAAHIGALLAQLIANAPDGLHSIIVADGGSTDGTRDIVVGVADREPRVVLVDNPARVQAAGVNAAARIIDPEVDVLIRIDAHSGYPDDYVSRLGATLAGARADSVVVRLRTRGDGCFQKAIAAASNSALGTGGAAHRMGGESRFIDHGHHAAFRRAAFDALGGYDERFTANEDAEFDVRLRRSGGRIWFASDIEVDYFPRRTATGLARQYLNYGRGRARNLMTHRERPRLRQTIAPLLLIGLCLCVAISPWLPLSLVVPAAYFMLTCVAGAVFAVQQREPCLIGMAFAVPIMHLAWAAGFLDQLRRGGDCIT